VLGEGEGCGGTLEAVVFYYQVDCSRRILVINKQRNARKARIVHVRGFASDHFPFKFSF
jgi:hypothetical protein